MFKVLVTGDRNWTDKKTIHDALSMLPEKTTIIQGGARGADTIAYQSAIALGYKGVVHKAEWDLHGKRAGPLRNIAMLKEKPDLVLAFHSNLKGSKGTAHMVRVAKAFGIPVVLISGWHKE